MIISAELVIVGTVMVLGVITGLACVQQAVVAELQDFSAAIRSLNQSYGFTGFRGCMKWWGRTSWTSGSRYTNQFNGCVGGNCGMGLMGNASSELGAGQMVYVSPGPSTTAAPITPVPDPCITAPQTQRLPEAPVSPGHCEPCQGLPGGLVPAPQGLPVPPPSIPQGPVPQTLPQL